MEQLKCKDLEYLVDGKITCKENIELYLPKKTGIFMLQLRTDRYKLFDFEWVTSSMFIYLFKFKLEF